MLARLRAAGILGINRRNAGYTLKWNRRSHYPLVDNKLETKRICVQAGIPVPRLLASAHHHFEINGMLASLAEHASFVLKPVHGAMGNGIIVILRRENERYVRSGGRPITPAALAYHAAGIISGLYALGGQTDVAMIEERLEIHPAIANLVAEGVPDIRVVVYRGIPVMAMTRLPTVRSGGRANLHQGAIGVGIDLSTGYTSHAVLGGKPLTVNADTGERIIGVELPAFARILEIAVAATDQTGLGYVGADVVVDGRLGPVILELNARPGLAIQLANRAGLCPRLDAVDALWKPGQPMAERVEIGRQIARAAARNTAT
jgi:alpha-L-glutamate ligase-like protein